MNFYVYVIRDPRPGKAQRAIYVGKGSGWRSRFHWSKAESHYNPLLRRVFAKIAAAGLVPIIKISARFEVERAAFAREIELIALYGRRDLGTGTLCNLTHGGEGAAGGLSQIRAMSELNTRPEIRKAKAAHLRKRNTSPESKARMSQLHADPIYAAAHAAKIRERYDDPVYKARHTASTLEAQRKLQSDPAFVEMRAENSRELMKANWAKPEFAKGRSENIRRLNADPEFQAKAKAAKAAKRKKS